MPSTTLNAAQLQTAARNHLLLHFGQHANLRNGQDVFLPERGEGVYLHDAAGSATSTACPPCSAPSSATPTAPSSPRRPSDS
ncbi:hypothetical protein ABZV31_27310 [Streptomyces sp. NPDC005202]|uniref:hypothetical protein n=1 Tax=Streptomyces sp. NPDC005202 TaxID=3157021 RepID=UPI0033B6F291